MVQRLVVLGEPVSNPLRTQMRFYFLLYTGCRVHVRHPQLRSLFAFRETPKAFALKKKNRGNAGNFASATRRCAEPSSVRAKCLPCARGQALWHRLSPFVSSLSFPQLPVFLFSFSLLFRPLRDASADGFLGAPRRVMRRKS